MSIRTIVEFNHDLAFRLDNEGQEFVRLLGIALRGGMMDNWRQLERFGIRFGVSTHHSTERKVVTPYQTVEF